MQIELEKQREKELFEKNFQASTLYINQMGLDQQRSFIKNSSQMVYHKNRIVKVDNTNNTYQRSAVPVLSSPSAVLER